MSAKNMTNRWLFGSAVALSLLVTTRGVEAQEIQLTGPLAGAPNVRKLRLHRAGRFEAALMGSFSLLDEYRRTIAPGLRLQYNFKEWIGIGVWGAYGLISYNTDLSDQIQAKAPRVPQTSVNIPDPKLVTAGEKSFDKQTAQMQWFAAPQVTFSPFRGKLGLFQAVFPDTDLYFHLGAAFIGINERADCTVKNCSTSHLMATRVAIAPTFGLGLTFYTGKLISFGAEYRALPFAWNRAGFDTKGAGQNGNFPDTKVDSTDRSFKFNQMFSAFIGFSFPELKTSE
jgi:hypothetical protein